jgi:hypothetical protein
MFEFRLRSPNIAGRKPNTGLARSPHFAGRMSILVLKSFQSIVANMTVSVSFSLSLNICRDNRNASDTLSYDVASLSSLPTSSLMAVLNDVVSFSNLGLIATIGVSNSNNYFVCISMFFPSVLKGTGTTFMCILIST